MNEQYRPTPLDRKIGWTVATVVLVLLLGIPLVMYSTAKSDCTGRGGHLETIWSQNVGWVCVGAKR